MNSQQDVVIIGGGVIGICSEYYLAQKGIQVTLIEKGEIASGCSYGNGGLIVPSHSVPLASPGALGTTVGANNGGVMLWIDDIQQANLTGIDNDTLRTDRVRLGAITGVDAGTSGIYYQVIRS